MEARYRTEFSNSAPVHSWRISRRARTLPFIAKSGCHHVWIWCYYFIHRFSSMLKTFCSELLKLQYAFSSGFIVHPKSISVQMSQQNEILDSVNRCNISWNLPRATFYMCSDHWSELLINVCGHRREKLILHYLKITYCMYMYKKWIEIHFKWNHTTQRRALGL